MRSAAAGGLRQISGARIDDVALGRLLKRAGGRCWLGLTTDVTSARPYGQLADIWDMVARSAYTQLNYSLAATASAVAGLAWLYLLPPAAGIAGLIMLGAGAGRQLAAVAHGCGPGRLADDGGDIPADAALVPAIPAARTEPPADRGAVRRDDRRLGAAPPARPWRGVERPPGNARLADELVCRPCRRARCAERHVNLAEQIRTVRTRDHGIEWLADAGIGGMGTRAEAQAWPVAEQLLRALPYSFDLGASRQFASGVDGRANPLQRVSHCNADSPADLSQPVRELVIAAIGHRQIVSPGATQSQRAVSRPPMITKR